MTILTVTRCLGVCCALALAGCAPAPQAALPADTRAADEAAIRKTDADWLKAAQTKQVDAWVAFYSDDAVVLAPNEKLAADKASIRKGIEGLLGAPAMNINWQLTKIDVARSGDLGYGYGTYTLSMNDDKGKPINDQGKILEVWKKQADGNWKCVADTWNSDLPTAAPPK